jgi:hypothetical protein
MRRGYFAVTPRCAPHRRVLLHRSACTWVQTGGTGLAVDRRSTSAAWCRDTQRCPPCDEVEVGVGMEQGRIGVDGDDCDQAVDQPADGHSRAPARAVYGCGFLVIRQSPNWDHLASEHEPPQLS